ncbi:MAG: HAD hydrolase-like protein [Clostridiales bacterium]|nr:HAD hydrolase-like protein [Clostridiales bacterium]
MPETSKNARLYPAIFLPGGEIRCRIIIFDFDGTIADTGPGIRASLRKAIEALHLPAKTDEELSTLIGPPIRKAFMEMFGLTEEQAVQAVYAYRRFYNQSGAYDALVYDGIPALLADLKTKGYEICVGTSKPWVVTHKILRHFHLRQYFNGVFGSFVDGRQAEKALVLQSIVEHYAGVSPLPPGRLAWSGEEGQAAAEHGTVLGVVPSGGEAAAPGAVPNSGEAATLGSMPPEENPEDLRALMIGDRYYDMEGAKAIGLPAIGVTFGYGTEAELSQAGASLIVNHPSEISAKLPPLR